jgi:acyl-CoA:acyl-CoA alkyltransferase
MRFENVAIASICHIEAPHVVHSSDLVAKLGATMDRLGIRRDVFEKVAGIKTRRVFDRDTPPSDAAAQAGELAIVDAGIERSQIGILINTSVCRDYLEPSTAAIVHGKLGLAEDCQNFDVGNACLAFLNGMDIAARMIERGDIDYALIVDGENSRQICDDTVSRLMRPETTEEQFRNELASLTLGSGGVAMVMGHLKNVPEGHRYVGSIARSATQFSKLCYGNIDKMITDTKMLLIEGLKLATKTYAVARSVFGWATHEIDEFVVHQVSRVHTEELIRMIGIDPNKVLTVFPDFGNIGPASVPFALSKLKQLGRLAKGKRIALFGIGSGLNCSLAEVVW